MRRRLTWIRLYEATQDVGLVCRRCGISGPTLRKWLRRYAEQGEAGLVAQSRRPKTSPRRKVFEQEEAWILELRQKRNLGARRIQQELRRLHRCCRACPGAPRRSDLSPFPIAVVEKTVLRSRLFHLAKR